MYIYVCLSFLSNHSKPIRFDSPTPVSGLLIIVAFSGNCLEDIKQERFPVIGQPVIAVLLRISNQYSCYSDSHRILTYP